MPDYLRVLSMKSKSLNDPDFIKFLNDNKILSAEKLDPNIMIYD